LSSKFHFVKQILGGIFVTIAMVGLDQDLMQKNFVWRNWNVCFHRNICLINIFFFSRGTSLYLCCKKGIEVPTDVVTETKNRFTFPEMPSFITLIPSVIFLRIDSGYCYNGLCLNGTNLLFCVDFLGMDKTENRNKPTAVKADTLRILDFAFLCF
jgi:hypothetical protein